ncbi:DnaD domain protein [Mycoplasma sp. Mirounga ES2805-ORL]|uniref:DnaD domain protein n=1 Tax=Mycoplasma sp. Mirounga ES2805-ORL TaxID=754514 RepID=UPI00197C9AEF|nr:DnaD domain protein [Mycoplasma sp. Mirounga ES2805-ORL]QSF13482.1 DnaD domain protein [Mycoplasma sp. Mirounga ES2805-ORL]
MIQNVNYPYFSVEIDSEISEADLKNLRKFYAPILGSEAILLYEYLRDLGNNNEDAGFFDFDSLTYFLNLSNKELNSARINLESVSLLSTFVDHVNRKTFFILEKPLNKGAFKKNLILANKLIKIIGEQNFQNLMGRERNAFLSKVGKYLVNVSAKYDDVFEFDEFDLMYRDDQPGSHELDTSDINTKEINEELNEKLEFNTFDFPNPYEAILKTDSRYFFSQITHKMPTEELINLIKNSREAGLNDPCINLVFFYAYEVNNKINFKYVDKIIVDLIKKEIFSFDSIEKYLDNMVKIKNNVAVTKKELYKATYLENLKKQDSFSDY